MYHSSSSVFHDQQTPNGAKKHHKSTEPKSWNSQNRFSSTAPTLCAVFYTKQSTTPSLFHIINFEVSQSTWKYPFQNYGFNYNGIASIVCMYKALIVATNITITQDWWIGRTVSVREIFLQLHRYTDTGIPGLQFLAGKKMASTRLKALRCKDGTRNLLSLLEIGKRAAYVFVLYTQ